MNRLFAAKILLVVLCLLGAIQLPWLEHALAQLYGEGDPFDAVDLVLKEREWANIAFNAPEEMNLEETRVIQLLLDMNLSIESLQEMLQYEGQQEGYAIKVSDRMEARLTGQNFAVVAITREKQAVTRMEPTEWKWEIQPTKMGQHHLHLTLSADFSIDGEPASRVIRTFDKIIDVDVTWNQRVGAFFGNNWQWVWAAMLAPLAGWLWTRFVGPWFRGSR